MFLTPEDVSHAYKAASKSLVDVKVKLGLPLSGSIFFPFMYTSKRCFHLPNALSSKLNKLGYIYASGITLFGGPHMYFLFKKMDSSVVDAFFLIQVVMFFIYLVKKHVLLNESVVIDLMHAPLWSYTECLSENTDRVLMLKTLFLYLVFFGLVGSFFAYAIFIKEHYFLFLFLFGSLTWLFGGALIIAIALIKSHIKSSFVRDNSGKQ